MLSCLSLNVCGVKDKLQRAELIDLVNKNDICCLLESKLTATDVAEFKGYVSLYKNRTYSEHPSGGVLTLIKESIAPFVTVYENESEKNSVYSSIKYEFVNHSLCSEAIFFNIGKRYLGRDIMFVGAYIYHKGLKDIDYFSQIEESLLFLKVSNICILGDLNARTAQVQDVFDERVFFNTFDFTVEGDSNIFLTDRVSQDTQKPDKWSRRLIELCKNFNLAIVNGRTGADAKIGKPTCQKSVLDYFILSKNLFRPKMEFDILDFDKKLSDIHCPVVLQLEIQPDDAQPEDKLKVNPFSLPVEGKQPYFCTTIQLRVDAIISITSIIHYYLTKKKDLYYVFIDDEKASDLISYLFRNRKTVMGDNFISDEEDATIKMFRPSFSEHRVLFSETTENLQNVLHSIENYCNKQNIQIDPNKIHIIAFCKGEIQTKEEIYFNGEKLDVIPHFYYFTFDADLRNVYDRALREMILLLRNNLFPVDTKDMLFEKFILPILSYNWKQGDKTNFLSEKLKTKFDKLKNKQNCSTAFGLVPNSRHSRQ